MANRPDISDKVIHFTKGNTYHDALERLLTIAGEGRLIGGNGMIKGGYRCVCFTEAPLSLLSGGLVNSNAFSRYAPFGIMFEKDWLYAQGARPVIYQPDSDFSHLPEEMRYRHVIYEPTSIHPIDFTWEREWRLHTDELFFSPNDAVLIVPDHEAEAMILDIWETVQELQVEPYSTILEQPIIEQMIEPCPWRIAKLSA